MMSEQVWPDGWPEEDMIEYCKPYSVDQLPPELKKYKKSGKTFFHIDKGKSVGATTTYYPYKSAITQVAQKSLNYGVPCKYPVSLKLSEFVPSPTSLTMQSTLSCLYYVLMPDNTLKSYGWYTGISISQEALKMANTEACVSIIKNYVENAVHAFEIFADEVEGTASIGDKLEGTFDIQGICWSGYGGDKVKMLYKQPVDFSTHDSIDKSYLAFAQKYGKSPKSGLLNHKDYSSLKKLMAPNWFTVTIDTGYQGLALYNAVIFRNKYVPEGHIVWS